MSQFIINNWLIFRVSEVENTSNIRNKTILENLALKKMNASNVIQIVWQNPSKS